MKKELKQLLIVMEVILILLCPVSAWAATLAFGEQLASASLLSILMTFLLSTLMGVTSLLHVMKKKYEEEGEIKRIWLFISSNMAGSNAAGLLVYFAAETWDIPNSYRAASIMMAAFGGTWFIERALKSFADRHLPEGTKS